MKGHSLLLYGDYANQTIPTFICLYQSKSSFDSRIMTALHLCNVLLYSTDISKAAYGKNSETRGFPTHLLPVPQTVSLLDNVVRFLSIWVCLSVPESPANLLKARALYKYQLLRCGLTWFQGIKLTTSMCVFTVTHPDCPNTNLDKAFTSFQMIKTPSFFEGGRSLFLVLSYKSLEEMYKYNNI